MSHYADKARIYVGNLPPDVRNRDIEDLFYKFGKINFIDLKNRRGPPFAFIEFDDSRDAEDAVDSRDGYNFDGYKLRVEFPRGTGRDNSSVRSFGYGFPSRSRGPPRRSGYRAYISGLPFSGSWQDLKDHMREAGEICFADVFKDGTGIVEFVRREDLRYAVKYLDDTKFRSHEGDTAYIRVSRDSAVRGRSMSRSRSRSRSLSYSPKSRDRSVSHGRSISRSRSRSYSRSRSRSNSRSTSSSPRKSFSRSHSPPPRRSRNDSRSRSSSRD